MKLEDLQVYQMAMSIGEDVWNHVAVWDRFAKDSMGKQLTRSVDSIAANLSEGYGRYSYRENKQFSYYARGSLYETRTWLEKSRKRKLFPQSEADALLAELETLARKLNAYIASIGEHRDPPSAIREGTESYDSVSSLPPNDN